MADWTVEEARAYLPRLQRLLLVIRRSARMTTRARSNGHGKSVARAEHVGETGAEGDDALTAQGEESDEDELASLSPGDALSELEERGVVLREVERGLVDFPCRHPSGKTVLLCWQLGEPDLAWWHLPEEGFAGRRPLPLPPDL